MRHHPIRRPIWVFVACVRLAAGTWEPSPSSDPHYPLPVRVRRALETEDWPAVLDGLTADPLTNATLRLVAVRALYETGRLPEELFSWFHSPGPELLSTSELRQYVGALQIADALLHLGHVNAAERLAFDSLEFEGESPAVLRTLARLHVVKGFTNAARIFLNRLQAYPEHSAWALRFREALATNSPAAADPAIARIHANLVTRDRIASGLTTERLLRQALEAHPENRMAFQFLMAHQLLMRQLLQARQTLATSSQVREGPLPRHYGEAMLLHRQLYPGISLGPLLARVPAEVETQFHRFEEIMNRATRADEPVEAQARREFGNTYWYYHVFGSVPMASPVFNPRNP